VRQLWITAGETWQDQRRDRGEGLGSHADKNKRRSLVVLYFHHRVNFPNRVPRHVLSPIALIFRSMANVPERFSNNCDIERRIREVQLLCRASVKGKSRVRPTKNPFAKLTPLLLCGDFTHYNARFVSSSICKRDMKVSVCFDFHINNAASECVPIVLNPGAL
jgi:hypothetical protein